jgi:hypothetical protein
MPSLQPLTLASLLVALAPGAARADTASPSGAASPTCCAIVELRQYTTYPGKREVLIPLFEQTFIESQEAVGIRVVGQFRDLDDPNRFVWIRGFADMPARAKALQAFYSGPAWKAHRNAANATMYDSDNVLLLHPARTGAGFALAGVQRPGLRDAPGPTDFVVVTTYQLAQPVTDAFVRWFDDTLLPVFTRSGATVIAELVSDHSENTFPRLPVREAVNAFVWIARFDDRAAYERYLARLAADARWSNELFAALHKQLRGFPEVVRLEPTARSLIGHRPRTQAAQ